MSFDMTTYDLILSDEIRLALIRYALMSYALIMSTITVNISLNSRMELYSCHLVRPTVSGGEYE